MGLEHALGVQPPPQFFGVGDWDHLSGTVPEAPVWGLVTRNGGRRGAILIAKGKQETDHVLRAAVLPLVHLDLDPRLDRFSSERKVNDCVRSRGSP